MSHNRVQDSKHFVQSSTRYSVNLSCPDNDIGNAFVHCSFGLMSGREIKLTSFAVFYLINGLDIPF